MSNIPTTATPPPTPTNTTLAPPPASVIVVSEPHPETVAGFQGERLIIDSEDKLLGEQLTYQWEKVVGGQREQLIMGAMMLKLREFLISRAKSKNHSGSGRFEKGTGMKAWLLEFAPKVSQTTSWRLMEIAEGVAEEFKLGKKVDLEALLSAQVGTLADDLAAKRAQIEEVIAGQSQRQLLLQFGKAAAKERGGNTSGTSQKEDQRTPEEKLADQIAAMRKQAAEVFDGVTLLRGEPAWKALNEPELAVAADDLEGLLKEIKAHLLLPPGKRPVVGLPVLTEA